MNDIVGKKFARLTVLSEIERRNGRRYFLCKCDCGALKYVSYGNLVSGAVKSCGCLQREISSSRMAKINAKHNETGSHLYRIWSGMKTRCTNPNHKYFKYYGGKGIEVCAAWMTFEGFKDWALCSGFKDGLSLDRIDNSKGYCPDNCRWIEPNKQQRNRANCHYVTVGNLTLPLIAWAEQTGISYNTILSRLRYGWDEVAAVTTPSLRRENI